MSLATFVLYYNVKQFKLKSNLQVVATLLAVFFSSIQSNLSIHVSVREPITTNYVAFYSLSVFQLTNKSFGFFYCCLRK